MRYEFDVYGTVVQPPSINGPALPYLTRLAQRAEKNGFTGLLAFYNHHGLDPWVVAAAIMRETATLVPLVAVQPYASPPFTVAKTIASLASIYHRRVDLNIVTGAAPHELRQVGETLTHDERYQRANEYAQVIRKLLTRDEPLDWEGTYYRFRGLRTRSLVPSELVPRLFVAGSSPASRELAADIGDVIVTHPEPVENFRESFVEGRANGGSEIGVRLGLLARPTEEEAWTAARDRYVTTRSDRLQTLLQRESQSDWIRRMAALVTSDGIYDRVYWTGLFGSGRAAAPMLVGSYDSVARYLERYRAAGVTKLLVAQVETEEDFAHARAVLSAVRV
jgi:alkanesulfonate monooxygenase